MDPLRGFTLVELLVVVAIIAILLAMMGPALDRAVYQAELAVCGSNLKAIAPGAVGYAMDSRRAYPDKRSYQDSSRTASVYGNLWSIFTLNENGQQFVPQIRSYIPLGSFIDPLAGRVNPDVPTAYVWSSYTMFFGWRYDGHQGMSKLGQRFEAKADPRVSPYPVRSFNVLANDRDWVKNAAGQPSNWGWASASHPDDQGGLAPVRSDTADLVTVFWDGYSNPARGLLDTQSVYEDGAVERFNNVGMWDDRMAYVPLWGNDPPRPGTTPINAFYVNTVAAQVPRMR